MNRRTQDRLHTLLLAVSAAFVAPNALAVSSFTAVNVGNLGTNSSGQVYSVADVINNAGQVAGQSKTFDNGQDNGNRAFLWSNGVITNLGALGTATNGNGYSSASALNEAGQVAGGADLYVNGIYKGARAVLWSNGSTIDLGSLGTAGGYGFSYAQHINEVGQVAGVSTLYGNDVDKGQRAALWSNGSIINLTGNLGTRADGVGTSWVSALNDAGQVAGTSYLYGQTWPEQERAFIWQNGTVTTLGSFGTTSNGMGYSSASDINDAGQVVGLYSLFENGQEVGNRAFVWADGTMQDLNDLVDVSSLAGFTLVEALDINDAGQDPGHWRQRRPWLASLCPDPRARTANLRPAAGRPATGRLHGPPAQNLRQSFSLFNL